MLGIYSVPEQMTKYLDRFLDFLSTSSGSLLILEANFFFISYDFCDLCDFFGFSQFHLKSFFSAYVSELLN
jgi:hypothetical protein